MEGREEAVWVNGPIHEADRMWPGHHPTDYAQERYLEAGTSALECIRPVVQGLAIRRVLDLPCGHGRVLRSLKAEFPDAELVACDILEDGVQFCAETFGAQPVLAPPDPKDITMAGNFDLIWVGSLLTHLQAGRWTDFMDLFQSLLAPGGALVITTHGRRAADFMRSGKNDLGLDAEARARILENFESGFAYEDYRNQDGYGISLSAPWWVIRHLERERLRLVNFTERGWGRFQDVYTIRAEPI